jgi:hypothetical protein
VGSFRRGVPEGEGVYYAANGRRVMATAFKTDVKVVGRAARAKGGSVKHEEGGEGVGGLRGLRNCLQGVWVDQQGRFFGGSLIRITKGGWAPLVAVLADGRDDAFALKDVYAARAKQAVEEEAKEAAEEEAKEAVEAKERRARLVKEEPEGEEAQEAGEKNADQPAVEAKEEGTTHTDGAAPEESIATMEHSEESIAMKTSMEEHAYTLTWAGNAGAELVDTARGDGTKTDGENKADTDKEGDEAGQKKDEAEATQTGEKEAKRNTVEGKKEDGGGSGNGSEQTITIWSAALDEGGMTATIRLKPAPVAALVPPVNRAAAKRKLRAKGATAAAPAPAPAPTTTGATTATTFQLTRVVNHQLLGPDLDRMGDFKPATDTFHVCSFQPEHGGMNEQQSVWRPVCSTVRDEIFFGDSICRGTEKPSCADMLVAKVSREYECVKMT